MHLDWAVKMSGVANMARDLRHDLSTLASLQSKTMGIIKPLAPTPQKKNGKEGGGGDD